MDEEVSASKSRDYVIMIAGGAIFGALSMAVSPITGSIPRMSVGFGMAILDPISIIWLISFLIFGWKAGLLTCGIGYLGITFLSPETAGWLGGLMKFCATVPFIIVPALIAKLRNYKASDFKGLKLYGTSSGLSILLRLAIIIPMNVFFAIGLYATIFGIPVQVALDAMTAWLAPIGLSGWGAVILTIAVMNIWQRDPRDFLR